MSSPVVRGTFGNIMSLYMLSVYREEGVLFSFDAFLLCSIL